MPKISVNIPVYNGEKTIARAVQSILSQSFTDFELVIVNDASKDSTPQILNEFKDSRIKIIHHEQNQGISRARNMALRNSQGDYIMVLDADDLALPDRMRKQVQALDQDSSLDGSFSRCLLFTDNPDEPLDQIFLNTNSSEMREMILFQNPFYHSSACLRRHVMGQGYREDLNYAEDYAKWLELIFSGKRLKVLPEPLAKYSVHPGAHGGLENMRGTIKKLHRQYFNEVFEKKLSAEEAETQVTLYGFPNRTPTSHREAVALASDVERWISTLAKLEPLDSSIVRARLISYARMRFYLLLADLAPTIGLDIMCFSRHFPPSKRFKLLIKSQLAAKAHIAHLQQNTFDTGEDRAPAADSELRPHLGTLKNIKRATIGFLNAAGVSTRVLNSRWRRERLLILAYHGISLSDEHLWLGSQFMEADVFRRRMQILKNSGCSVLSLDEAVTRLYAGDLPERAAVITFDDGTSDFYRKAFPILKDFNFPVTLYLTTFYMQYNRPVFDLMCAYLLWKRRDAFVDLGKIIRGASRTDLSSEAARKEACNKIFTFTREQNLSATDKDSLLASLAKHVGVDYESMIDQRVMHNLTADEVRQLSKSGVDIQLHTHRHRTPLDHKLFIREIEDNRKSIHQITGKSTSHFCYPSGLYDLAFLPWLKEAGIVSATTCELGLASRNSNPLLLPRLLDTSSLSEIEFEGWLTGISSALPRSRQPKEMGGVWVNHST